MPSSAPHTSSVGTCTRCRRCRSLRIVHVGLPAEAREGFVVARDDLERRFGHRLEITNPFRGVGPFAPQHLARRQHPDIRDVALGRAAELDAIGTDQDRAWK